MKSTIVYILSQLSRTETLTQTIKDENFATQPPIWWGIVNVVVIELGLIIPPVGLIVFLLHGMVPRVSLIQLYRTVTPFIIADVVVLIILVLFPAVALFLPGVLY